MQSIVENYENIKSLRILTGFTTLLSAIAFWVLVLSDVPAIGFHYKWGGVVMSVLNMAVGCYALGRMDLALRKADELFNPAQETLIRKVE